MVQTRGKILTKRDGNAPHPGSVLVAIDFSLASRRALRHALSVADDSSRLILLHVVRHAQNEGLDLDRAMKSARQQLKQFCEIGGVNLAESITLDVRSGAPFREILDCARQNAVQMIVLGVDGASTLGGVGLGHTSDRVSRYATCPVLLVRDTDPSAASPQGTLGSKSGTG